MRDLYLIHKADKYTIDIDIIDGYPRLMPQASMTMDQRAAVATMIIKGTIPGMPEVGIDWSQYYGNDKSSSWVNIDNQMKQAIQDYANDPDDSSSSNIGKYYPLVVTENGTISSRIVNLGELKNDRT